MRLPAPVQIPKPPPQATDRRGGADADRQGTDSPLQGISGWLTFFGGRVRAVGPTSLAAVTMVVTATVVILTTVAACAPRRPCTCCFDGDQPHRLVPLAIGDFVRLEDRPGKATRPLAGGLGTPRVRDSRLSRADRAERPGRGCTLWFGDPNSRGGRTTLRAVERFGKGVCRITPGLGCRPSVTPSSHPIVQSARVVQTRFRNGGLPELDQACISAFSSPSRNQASQCSQTPRMC